MIVCVCRRLNEKHVEAAIAAGARTPRDVHAHHGCTINCGRCTDTVIDMIVAVDPSVSTQGFLLAAE